MDGLILAGGKSTRMGGRHKGELKYRNHTFLGRIAEELLKEADHVWISYGEKIYREYERCGTVKDRYPGCGPIGGLHAGLWESRSDRMMVSACDMPFLKMDFYRFLTQKMEEEEKRRGCLLDGVVPVADGRIHPLSAIYRKKTGAVLERQIIAGEYQLVKALEQMDILYADISGEKKLCRMLKNVNTLEEYGQLILERQKVIAVCGVKDSGKTTLLEKLVKSLTEKGLKIAVIKHDGHDFTCDVPGTDSYRMGQAGAYGTAVFSASRMFVHKRGEKEREEALIRLFPEADIIFLEGMKDSSYPKIEVIREGVSANPVSNPSGRFLIATNRKLQEYHEKAARLDDISVITEEILKFCGWSGDSQ